MYIYVCGICIHIYNQQVLERFGLLVSWSRFLDPVLEVSHSQLISTLPSMASNQWKDWRSSRWSLPVDWPGWWYYTFHLSGCGKSRFQTSSPGGYFRTHHPKGKYGGCGYAQALSCIRPNTPLSASREMKWYSNFRYGCQALTQINSCRREDPFAQFSKPLNGLIPTISVFPQPCSLNRPKNLSWNIDIQSGPSCSRFTCFWPSILPILSPPNHPCQLVSSAFPTCRWYVCLMLRWNIDLQYPFGSGYIPKTYAHFYKESEVWNC